MKVKIISGVCGRPWNLAHFPGDVVNLPDPLALELIEAKAAEQVVKASKKVVPKAETTENPNIAKAENATKK